jgi:adenosylcobinamide-phosphate synthase
MDSMIGYKNEKYLYFAGRAKLDDILNFIPARLAGAFMVLSAHLAGLDGKNARRVFKRDRLNHKSPNSAHTEAACAGALGVRLGGGRRLLRQACRQADDRRR